MKRPDGNLLLLQGGGPTPVFNATLAAAIRQARRSSKVGQILGAQSGMEGLCRGRLLDLTKLSEPQLDAIASSPGAALGTTRFKPSDDDLAGILDCLAANNIRWLVMIGGNGSQRGGHAIAIASEQAGQDLCVIGAPKTIDNDIVGTDRCPGFGSAANYIAQSVRDLGMDVRSLPQPVSILETMGRSVGWLAAATALAKRDADDAPHLIYLPETPFDLDRFIGDVDRVVARLGWAVVVVNEGLRRADGRMVFESSSATQRDALNRALPGGVAAFLAEEVTRSLKIRCRSEKPGLCGRASARHVSAQDRIDAELVGRAAVDAALDGQTNQMVSLRPIAEKGDGFALLPLGQAAGKDRAIPAEWLSDSSIGINDMFLKYVRPIAGALVDYAPAMAQIAPPAKTKIAKVRS